MSNASSRPAAPSPTIETANGRLLGAAADGVFGFKGIPYGAPTGGANRFMPPLPPEPWAGIREATSYQAQAPQLPGRPERRPELRTILGPADASPESEDCLTLNVWTPGAGPGIDNSAKRPVMVWLHGGAFAYGSGNRAVTDGSNLARRGDVVVVSVNHRLNIFGFLHLAEIGGERYAHSGNAGMLDLVAALEWVRDNIEGFGGDPGNVTIFGEFGRRREGQRASGDAGGARSVPSRRDPERRRDPGTRPRARDRADRSRHEGTRHRARRFGEAARGSGRASRGGDRACGARGRASGRCRCSTATISARPSTGPICRRSRSTRQLPEIARDIPLLIGGTREESGFFLADDDEVWRRRVSEESLRRRVAAVAGSQTDRALDVYRTLRPGASREDLLIAALTGSNFWVRTVMLAERKARQGGAPVYAYSLDWRSPACDGRLQAHHAMDLPFVFDNVDVPDTTRGAAGARELAAIVSATWATFARSGSPENPVLPHWPAYDGKERATMVFDRECRVVSDPDRDARLLWEPIATRPPE